MSELTSILLNEDNMIAMAGMEDNSFDSIVTDPPYGINFMGKKWDYDVPEVKVWEECLRVLKPGGFLLSFAGTRTQHRMCVNIEDAGFEIRDMIAWVYGSGFPKSLNIGKAVDKMQGNEREVVGKMSDIQPRYKQQRKDTRLYNKGVMSSENDMPLTKGSSEGEGWGTALKPALEPITVARKPLSEKTVAQNVLKWGVGGINIDGCRIGVGAKKWSEPKGGIWNPSEDNGATLEDNPQGRFPANFIHDGSQLVLGLFPESKGQQGDLKNHNKNRQSPNEIFGEMARANDHEARNDSGSAARFFYCAKASKQDRDEGMEAVFNLFEQSEGTEDKILAQSNQAKAEEARGNLHQGKSGMNTGKVRKNNHPTVKPTDLMRYLVRLVTPKGGMVLDPFMGSGSTGKACRLEGFGFTGIELDEGYFDIAKKRVG